MPNWCENIVSIAAPDTATADRIEAAFRRGELFHEFIPVPPSDPDWYAKRNAAWGVKWDVGAEEGMISRDADVLHLGFLSAWVPPIAFFEHLVALGCGIEADYLEPSMMFCGSFLHGRDLPTSYQVQADIPARVVTAFGGQYIDNLFDWYDPGEETGS